MQSRWPAGILDRALSERVVKRIGDSDRRAALIGRSANSDVLSAVVRMINPVELQRIQSEVLAGHRVPEY